VTIWYNHETTVPGGRPPEGPALDGENCALPACVKYTLVPVDVLLPGVVKLGCLAVKML
jgi:hypothetical protein